MYRGCKGGCAGFIPVLGLVVWTGSAAPAYAAGATRDLPEQYGPGVTLTVSIAIDPPPDPVATGVEDSPPAGWSVSNISDDGVWDAQNGKVKWGPFFGQSVPPVVTYDVTPQSTAMGEQCFSGIVSFDVSGDQPIGGDQCIAVAIPTLSEWGLIVLAFLLVAAGSWVYIKRSRAIPGST